MLKSEDIPSLETQGFKGGWEGKGETGRVRKKEGRGDGKEKGKGVALGSFSFEALGF